MEMAGYSQEQIEAALSDIGLDVDLGPFEGALDTAVEEAAKAGEDIAAASAMDSQLVTDKATSTDVSQGLGYNLQTQTATGFVTIPNIRTSEIGYPQIVGSPQRASVTYPYFKMVPDTEEVETTKEVSGSALRIKHLGKTYGGNIKKVQRNPSSKKGSGSKKGKSGGSTKKPTTAKTSTTTIQSKGLTHQHDPYEQQNKAIARQSDVLKTLQNQQKTINATTKKVQHYGVTNA